MNKTHVAGAMGALILMSGLIVHASNAAFTATTENAGDNWQAGTVVLTDNDNNAAMFAVPALKPGMSGSRCIVVTYAGNLAANVKMYVKPGALTATTTSPLGKHLADYLTFTVTRGTGNLADCSDFSAAGGETVYGPGTLSGLAATQTSFATGGGTWAPTGTASESATYQFSWSLVDNNDAQGLDATATFTWEAQNT